MQPDYALRLQDLSFSYGRHRVLDGLSLDIARGSFTGILGRNGAGKTTLLRLMLGSLKPDSGAITRPGSALGRPIGYVGQGAIATRLPITAFEAASLGHASKEGAHKAREALELMGVDALSKRLYRELSGGQKQKIQIARCLASGSDLLLLDEPTASLDEASEEDFMDLMEKLNTEKGLSIVMISHDRALIQERAHRVISLDNGKITEGLAGHHGRTA